jgi:hypothetical protein
VLPSRDATSDWPSVLFFPAPVPPSGCPPNVIAFCQRIVPDTVASSAFISGGKKKRNGVVLSLSLFFLFLFFLSFSFFSFSMMFYFKPVLKLFYLDMDSLSAPG